MKCPIDQNLLVISERQGVEIDYCPQCRGVWLDRGELDKLIEKADATSSVQHSEPQRERHNDHTSHKQHTTKKRESFLGELFDF